MCDKAHETLVDHGLEPQLVDIDDDASLCVEFSTCVPVVTFDGKIRFRGQVEPVLLRRLLRGEQ